MEERIARLLKEFRAGLERIYGPRLRGVYLFGSYARGDADEESDVDVLVVLDDFERYGEEIVRTGQLGADLSLRYDVSLTQVFLRAGEWAQGDSAFLDNVREEAVPA